MRLLFPSAPLLSCAIVGGVLVTTLPCRTVAQAHPAAAPDTNWIRTGSGLAYLVLTKGAGPAAKAGQTVTIHESTFLENGTLVFSTRTRNSPVTFQLGSHLVIAGVDEGVTGMQAGERRLLVVPSALSQRSVYPANTPRDTTLRIDLELVAIRSSERDLEPRTNRRPPRAR